MPIDDPDAVAAGQAQFLLRPYVGDDLDACAGILDRAWRAGHPYAPRTIGRDEFVRETAGRTVLVAQARDGQVLGFMAIYGPESFIHHLYVDPICAGLGVGRMLLTAGRSLAGARATLKCQMRNTGALRFYRREGWTEGETGETDGEPWVRLHCPIAGYDTDGGGLAPVHKA